MRTKSHLGDAMMKTIALCSALSLALMALSPQEVWAQNAGRAASGERRSVDTSKDRQAYESLKTHVSSALSSVVSTSETNINEFNEDILEITRLVEEIEDMIAILENPANWHDENDPMVKPQADQRALGGTGVPMCNPQLHELVFDHNTSRWSCVVAGNACMATQNVWR
jgi:hypothetical protein